MQDEKYNRIPTRSSYSLFIPVEAVAVLESVGIQ